MVCDEAMEEQLNLWIYEMVTQGESIVDSTVVQFKSKEIYSQLPTVRKMLNPLLVLAGTSKSGTE